MYKTWLVVLKLTWISQNLTQALEKSYFFFFNWLLETKVYIVLATKVQRSFLSWDWGVMQILKKDWPVVWKKTRNLANFYKVQNWDFDGILLPKVEKMTLKFTEELCVMTMKNNTKFEEELTFHFKTDMRNLSNFDLTTRKSKKRTL